LGPAFFGLPKSDDPNFGKIMAERNVDLLREIRFISHEVGYREAMRMPVEVRRWWITEMQKESEQGRADQEALAGRRTADVK